MYSKPTMTLWTYKNRFGRCTMKISKGNSVCFECLDRFDIKSSDFIRKYNCRVQFTKVQYQAQY